MSEADELGYELVGSTTVIHFEGDLDAANADELATRAVDLCHDAQAVVLDFTATTYLDSAGIRLIDTVGRACGARGVAFAAIVPKGSVIRRVVELTLPTLELFDDVHTWNASTSGEDA